MKIFKRHLNHIIQKQSWEKPLLLQQLESWKGESQNIDS